MLEKDAGHIGVFQEVEQGVGQTGTVLRDEGTDGRESGVTQRRNGGRVLPLDTLGLQEGLVQLLRERVKNPQRNYPSVSEKEAWCMARSY